MDFVTFVRLAAAGLIVIFCTSCSENSSPAGAKDNLCAGKSGFGAQITGKAKPVEMCVPDDHVVGNIEQGVRTVYTREDRYDVTATITAADQTVYEIQMIFSHKQNTPQIMQLTGNLAEATANPDLVWMYYQEHPPQGDPLESVQVSKGSFTLSFSDQLIAVGTFSGVRLEIQNQNSHADAGARFLPEGFFSISTDP